MFEFQSLQLRSEFAFLPQRPQSSKLVDRCTKTLQLSPNPLTADSQMTSCIDTVEPSGMTSLGQLAGDGTNCNNTHAQADNLVTYSLPHAPPASVGITPCAVEWVNFGSRVRQTPSLGNRRPCLKSIKDSIRGGRLVQMLPARPNTQNAFIFVHLMNGYSIHTFIYLFIYIHIYLYQFLSRFVGLPVNKTIRLL
ncbi:unnamed protein product [Protopolystoma xenopodis]|uniref:Uncharacterized protein n=1 Tax=Protopolystoma xenopodis TaxID=117903 RepID=A0A448XFS8_9PLAT|nr:unnamed protein product [Protopolystoma xenopodis]